MGMRSGDGSSRYARGGPSLGQTVRLNHISKMVLSIVKFGGSTCTEASAVFELWLGGLGSRGKD